MAENVTTKNIETGDKAIQSSWSATQGIIKDALQAYFPIQGRFQALELKGIEFDDKLHLDDIKSQENAKNNERTWGIPVYGHISLIDKTTGKELHTSKVKLTTLPKLTKRFSYIVDGGEWQVESQWRLRSGIYAKRKENGQFHAEFNLAKQFAAESHVYEPFDPATKKFKFKYGTTNIPLYSMLKAVGISDEQMKKSWGEDIYKANLSKDPHKDILSFYNKLEKRGVYAEKAADGKVTYPAACAAIVKALDDTKLLPETTKATLGKPYTSMNGESLLHASNHILAVARGDKKPDDVHSLIFKELLGLDDYMHEKLTNKKVMRSLKSKIIANVDKKTRVNEIITSDLFNKPLKSVFTVNTLSQRPEQVNPLEMMSNRSITTITGLGGIQNEQAIRPEMKIINPSHFGYLDPIHTPESEKTGISLHLPIGVKKEGRVPKTFVIDLETGKPTRITPDEFHTNHVVFPDQVKIENGKYVPIAPKVKMMDPKTHEVVEKPFSQARYVLPSAKALFDEATNLIPFLQNNQGNRTMTGSRQSTQAVGLVHREEPLVQVQSEKAGLTWEKLIGNYFSHTAPVDGKVVEMNKDHLGHVESIVVQDGKNKHNVQLYNHFPLNDAKTFLHGEPKVNIGDTVKKGQVLADINYTKDGVLALGTNLHIGYLPYKGLTFEDGLVISESCAQKLSSGHLHKITLEIDPKKDTISKSKFLAFASTTSKKLDKTQLGKLSDDGIVKPGTQVKPGDVLIGAVGKNELTGQIAMIGSRLKGAIPQFKDKSVSWDSDYEGHVVKVVKHPNEKTVTVYVKTQEPLQVGDKLCGRHGNKGVVGAIIPDHEMPKVGGPDGKPLEIIMNSSGIASRINIGQMLETAASKIALKTGKPYIVNNFGGKDLDYTQKVKDDLDKLGLNPSGGEKIYDPTSGKMLHSEALAGHQYFFKLKHQVEKKLSVRGMDARTFGVNQEPKGGGEHGAQSLGQLEMYALLAAGARSTMKEASTYKAERHHDINMNETDFWDRVMLGQPLPPPKPTFAYRKFEALLTGLGINIKKTGHEHMLTPMTDKGVLAMSNGEVKDAGKMFRGKNEKELSQGLFDEKTTGGLPNAPGKGLKWSHLTLPEPLPNPIFVGTSVHPGPAVVLSGMTFKDFEEVVKGKKYVNGKTGGVVIKDLLSKVNVQEELKKTVDQLPKLRGSALNHANKKAKFLQALDNLKMKPDEAYVMQHIPVLPPIFRPIVPMEDGSLRFDDVNHLYKSVSLLSNKLKDHPPELPEETKNPLRDELYESVKAVAGLGTVPIYDSNRKLKGILDQIAGDSPKTGFFQSRIMKRRQELSMRSAITPEPAMDIDQVGLPKHSALELYKPFVIRELVKMGRDPIQAKREIKNNTDIVWRALERAIADRPVLLKRDPVLHKYNIQAFKPMLIEGSSVKLHPLNCHAFNADFDGDTMAAYLPLTEEAKREAMDKMLPSKNLFSSTTYGVMHAPDQEAVLGLHLLTKWGDKKDKSFSTYHDALAAKNKGDIHINDVIKVGGKDTTVGRLILAEKLPDKFKTDELLHGADYRLKKGNMYDLLEEVAKHDPKGYPVIVNHLKDLGNQFSYEEGFSFTLNDLNPLKAKRAAILKPYNEKAVQIHASHATPEHKEEQIVELYNTATKDLDKQLHEEYKKNGNNVYMMTSTGARGSAASFRQMNIAPMLMKDALNRTIPIPITKSYSEGLDIGDYWTTLHGARKGTLQRVEGTSEPGRLTKEIVNMNISTLVTQHDCGTKDGLHMHLHDKDGEVEHDVFDRHLASPVHLKDGVISEGTIITPDVHNRLVTHGVDKVHVRSPLKCSLAEGLCAKCIGLSENGKHHEIGTNIGVIASQALGEPATQLAMDAFHTGGVAVSRGGGSVDKFTRLEQLLNIPKVLPNAAKLAKLDGKIDKIEYDPSVRGHNIYIGKEKHFVPAQRKITVDIGDKVEKGQLLTDGSINPRELLPLKGIEHVQDYLTDELYNKIYKSEGVRRRNIEVVTRNLTNYTKVVDPGSSHHLVGDTIQISKVNEFNRKAGKDQEKIQHAPILMSSKLIAENKDEDYLSRLNFQHLKDNLLSAAQRSWKTHSKGLNPIGPYAMGSLGSDRLPGY